MLQLYIDKDLLLEKIREAVGDSTSDNVLNLYEFIDDSDKRDETEDVDFWKRKYVELDDDWRRKYRDRFMSGESGDVEILKEEEEEEEEKEYVEYSDLFREE